MRRGVAPPRRISPPELQKGPADMTTVTLGDTATFGDLEDADDTELVDTYWHLVAIEHANAISDTITHEPLARRRWVEWCIGRRLDSRCIGRRLDNRNSSLHRKLTPGIRAHCRTIAQLDGDVLHDHLRRATTVTELSRRHILNHIDRAVQ
jgi:hypothetical protein